MSAIKIVIIGIGLIGREHCALVQKHPDAKLVGISDISPDAKQYAEKIGVSYYSDFEKLLEEIEPDGAIIALPNSLHVPVGLACLKLGIPCLVEKPISDTIESALVLVEASETSNVPVLIGHHRRHSPDIKEAKSLISGGAIGDLVAINGMWLSDKPDNYFEAVWRKKLGGGPFLINLIHDIDCLRYIVGEIESVQAFSSNAVRGFEVEDTASITLRFMNGVLGSFLISDTVASPYTWEITSGQALYFPHQPGDCYFFGGRKGSLAVPSMNLWRHDQYTEHWQHPFLRQHMPLDGSSTYHNQMEHFLNVISGDEKPVISARDGMLTLAATIAVDTAARENRTVTVNEIFPDF